MIQFGEWLPDQPDYMNTGVITATNVVPAASGYAPINEFVAYSGDATDTLLGIFAAKDNDGNIKLLRERLDMFADEKKKIQAVQNNEGLTRHAGALGEAANNVFKQYRENFAGQTINEGDAISIMGQSGKEMRALIRGIRDEGVILDFNHPLAGKNLRIDVEIISIS